MDAPDLHFLRTFYGNLEERSLDPQDAGDRQLYVPLYGDPELAPSDPARLLATTIEFSRLESAQLFSGFRGTGKSTELRRLREMLIRSGYLVALCDLRDHVNLSMPVDVSDFLVTLAGAFSEALDADDLLGVDPGRESYWTRFVGFLRRTKIEIEGAELGGDGATLKLSLKQDPSFRQRLQEHMQGHLGALVQDVRDFMLDAVLRLRKRHPDTEGVVLLLDSVEQIRGTSVNALKVESSVETLFAGHAEKLRFESLHAVYTVPPWLKIRSPGVEGLYSGGQLVPCVQVRDQQGQRHTTGLDALEKIVSKRGDWQRLLGPERATLDRLALASGGYLRDLLRLLKACVLRARQDDALPLTPRGLELVIDETRNDYLPIAADDALWLDQVRRTRQAALPAGDRLPDLARFFETHLVLCYRNGREWYVVHPLVEDEVQALAAAERARRDGAG